MAVVNFIIIHYIFDLFSFSFHLLKWALCEAYLKMALINKFQPKLQQKMALKIEHVLYDIVFEEEDTGSPHLHILLCRRLKSFPPPPLEQPAGRHQLYQLASLLLKFLSLLLQINKSQVQGDDMSLIYPSAKMACIQFTKLITPKGANVINKMILISKNRTYIHLTCTCYFVVIHYHHLLHLLNSLQVSVSDTSNISNVCVPKVKQFARASKLKILIGIPHSKSIQILLARIIKPLLPLLLLLTTCAFRCT
jgi:hypothetical protein